ncbi:MAG: hypothetical protein ACR2PK_16730 [Acidimicrobiales bacterium]
MTMSAIERPKSALARSPRERYLPDDLDSGYVIGAEESMAAALHRLTTEQFTVAINALSDPKADVGLATVATLKSMERISAVLRLVRTSIGDEAYRTELTIIKDTSDLLGGLMAGQPELRALDQLRSRFQPLLSVDAFTHLRSQLLNRHQLLRLQALSEGEALLRTLHRLRRARARFAAWPIDDRTDARMYGREPVSDSFATLTDGLARTYRRGRKHWQHAREGDASRLPKLQREVQNLQHQVQILSASWPEVLAATSRACSQLDSVLTEENGLAALHQAISAGESAVITTDLERSLLESIVSSTRAELTAIIEILGARMYVEPTRLFVARMEAYWSARSYESAPV